MNYTVTVTLDGTTLIEKEFSNLLAARVLAAEWSKGEFLVSITAKG
jgi:hypothetical protein